jgi:hypothetical protein
MDILYIVGKNKSKCFDWELRFSLRGIEKYGKNVGRVFVAGYCPYWLSDKVIKVPVDDVYPEPMNIVEKHINMLSVILHVVDTTDIDDEFLISMDDHFYIRETDFDNYPFYSRFFPETMRDDFPPSITPYHMFLNETRNLCLKHKLSCKNLTLHRNMHMSRKIINECRNELNTIIKQKIPCEHMMFLLNYWYTKYGFEITPTLDTKIKNIKNRWLINPQRTEVVSTSNFEYDSPMFREISKLYPEESKYEKPLTESEKLWGKIKFINKI